MPNRTTPVLVIAICHFVFGGLGLFCNVCSGVGRLAGDANPLRQLADQNMRDKAERQQANERIKAVKLPGYRFYTSFNVVMSWVLSAAMVAAGFGLLNVKPWGHWLSTGYGIASILCGLVVLFYGIFYLNPLEMELLRNNPPPAGLNQQQTKEILEAVGPLASAGPCCLMIYPIAVLVVMFLPSTLAAFSGGNRSRTNIDDD
jgi:uncharacterized protein YneF (UPF0154 family)